MSTSSTTDRGAQDRWFVSVDDTAYPYIISPTTTFYLHARDYYRRVRGWRHRKDAERMAAHYDPEDRAVVITRAELDAMYASHKAREALAGPRPLDRYAVQVHFQVNDDGSLTMVTDGAAEPDVIGWAIS